MRHGVQHDHKLTDVLLRAVEIGRVDMSLENYMLSTNPALPHIRHLEQVMHIVGYLKAHPKRKLAFDPLDPLVSEGRLPKYDDWEDFYRGAKEAIPGDMPTHCFEEVGRELPVVDWDSYLVQQGADHLA